MTKCVRPSCDHELGPDQVEVDGKVYCCQACVDHCTDEECVREECKCGGNGECGCQSTDDCKCQNEEKHEGYCQGHGHHGGCCKNR
ncbi:hypothetical protein [Facklamia lactis]|uniref:hypothetical protein n=1 Tax=Facklamia lactis TaxID=2749967 RepID=UPI001F35B5D0|nr:hypothetical protein [Facklamia lactis]